MAEPVEETVVEGGIEEHGSGAVGRDVDDFGRDGRIEDDAPAGTGASAGFREREPAAAAVADRPEEEDLDETVLGVAAVEPGGSDADVVADEKIAGKEKLGQIREAPMCHDARPPVEREQAARAARPRLLGDPIGGEVIVESVDAHGGKGMSPEVTNRASPEADPFCRAAPGGAGSGLYAGSVALVRGLH
jgi:hypothetical protein